MVKEYLFVIGVFLMAKAGRKSDDAVARRRLIKKWVLEEGLTNRSEMQRRLADAGFVVTRQTVYKDFAKAASFSDEELAEFDLDVMALFKKYIHELEVLIAKEMSSSKKASLIRTLSQIIKDKHTVANNIALRESREDKVLRGSDGSLRGDRDVTIMFGD